MGSISAGLPEVEQVVAEGDEADHPFQALLKKVDINQLKQAEFDMLYKFDPEAAHWACRVCREQSPKDKDNLRRVRRQETRLRSEEMINNIDL